MIHLDTTAVLAGILILWAAVTLLYLFVRQQRELKALRDALRVFSREGRGPRRVRFQSAMISSIWRAILAQPVRERSLTVSGEAFTDALSLSTELAKSASEVQQAAEAVGELLRTRVGPDVMAVSVLVRERNDEGARVVYSSGVPLARIEGSLLISFDALIDANTESAWGYQDATQGTFSDFSVFGISRSLFVPLRNEDAVCGAIWLGFRTGALGLTPERKRFLLALTEHAAASFYAAQQAEARSEESRRERDFLLGMSHDLRAPSNRALLAIREILEEEHSTSDSPVNNSPINDSSVRGERLREVEQSILEQLELLGDVLEFAKTRKGFLRAEKEVFDIAAALKRIAQRHVVDAERKGITLRVRAAAASGVEADPVQIRRVLDNLVSNAIKYSDGGVVELCVEREESLIRVLVLDEGRGVADGDRASLFDEFSVGEEGRRSGGIGLGLALSRALAKLNGASVFYRPREERGSVFGVCLNAVSDEVLSLSEGGRALTSELPAYQHALVADDHSASCRMTIRYLKDAVIRCTPASSSRELLALAQQVSPDLIVTDWHFADGSLGEVIEDLPPLRTLVIVSGRARIPELPKKLAIERVCVLQKPLVREQLIEALGGLGHSYHAIEEDDVAGDSERKLERKVA